MLSEKLAERRDEICNKFNLSKERFDNAYDYLMSQDCYNRQGDIAVVDYLEAQVKMFYYGAANKLPGE